MKIDRFHGEKANKVNFNTTIDQELHDAFREKCKENRIPVNEAIESFMKKYNEGGFQICLRENK